MKYIICFILLIMTLSCEMKSNIFLNHTAQISLVGIHHNGCIDTPIASEVYFFFRIINLSHDTLLFQSSDNTFYEKRFGSFFIVIEQDTFKIATRQRGSSVCKINPFDTLYLGGGEMSSFFDYAYNQNFMSQYGKYVRDTSILLRACYFYQPYIADYEEYIKLNHYYIEEIHPISIKKDENIDFTSECL